MTDTIDRLIALYRPDTLVVGTRGKRGLMAMGMNLGGIGSVSKYVILSWNRNRFGAGLFLFVCLGNRTKSQHNILRPPS